MCILIKFVLQNGSVMPPNAYMGHVHNLKPVYMWDNFLFPLKVIWNIVEIEIEPQFPEES